MRRVARDARPLGSVIGGDDLGEGRRLARASRVALQAEQAGIQSAWLDVEVACRVTRQGTMTGFAFDRGMARRPACLTDVGVAIEARGFAGVLRRNGPGVGERAGAIEAVDAEVGGNQHPTDDEEQREAADEEGGDAEYVLDMPESLTHDVAVCKSAARPSGSLGPGTFT